MRKTHYRKLADPALIGLLESEVKQEILDTIRANGVSTIREIAAAIGRPADGLYYHVRQLVVAGLLREQRAAGRGPRSAAAYALPRGISGYEVKYAPESAENVAAVTRIARAMSRMACNDFARGFREALAAVHGPHRNLWAARQKAWLSADELAELNRLLERIQQIMAQAERGADRSLCVLSYFLAPVDPQDPRREANRS